MAIGKLDFLFSEVLIGVLSYFRIGFDLRILGCLIRVCLRIYCVLMFILLYNVALLIRG